MYCLGCKHHYPEVAHIFCNCNTRIAGGEDKKKLRQKVISVEFESVLVIGLFILIRIHEGRSIREKMYKKLVYSDVTHVLRMRKRRGKRQMSLEIFEITFSPAAQD